MSVLGEHEALIKRAERLIRASERARIAHFLRNQWGYDGENAQAVARGLADIIENNDCDRWTQKDPTP